MRKPGKSGPASSRLKSKASAPPRLHQRKYVRALKSNTLWAGFAAGPRRVLRAAAFFGASPVVASALDLHSGATPAENHYLSRGGKPLARSVTFLNDPTEPISVMLLNDLTGGGFLGVKAK